MANEQAETDGPTSLGAVAGVVLTLAPELGRWVFASESGSLVDRIQAAVLEITGTDDTAAQMTALSDGENATRLRVALARLAATEAEREKASLVSRISAALDPLPGVPGRAGFGQGAPVVSAIVLLTFALVIVIALTRSMPQGAEPVLNVLLGTLGAMATSVVGYWVGSSAGSARKDERLASMAERG